MAPVRFRTATLNVKSNPVMPQEQVRHDVRRIAREASIIGWQEIDPQRYRDAIRNLPEHWNHFMPKGSTNPISWNGNIWKKVAGDSITTHPGRAEVSPHRNITWVKLEHKDTGKKIVRINTHLISGAWSNAPKKDKAWRQEMWKEHMRDLDQLVARFERQGHEVIIGGDFNRDSFRVMGDDVRFDNKLNVGTHGKSTLDYLMHTKGPELRKLDAWVHRGYASDHDAVIGRDVLKG